MTLYFFELGSEASGSIRAGNLLTTWVTTSREGPFSVEFETEKYNTRKGTCDVGNASFTFLSGNCVLAMEVKLPIDPWIQFSGYMHLQNSGFWATTISGNVLAEDGLLVRCVTLQNYYNYFLKKWSQYEGTVVRTYIVLLLTGLYEKRLTGLSGSCGQMLLVISQNMARIHRVYWEQL
jgi:hypothetical protein